MSTTPNDPAGDWKARYPDHHEGVRGVRRDDDLLSLDERAVAHRLALVAVARHLRSATSVGNPAPIVARMAERLRTPQVGDFVVEDTGLFGIRRDLDHRIKAQGYLLARRQEWWETAEQWAKFEEEYPDEATEAERTTDEAWYVQYGPNERDVCRWSNCSFTVVPIDPAMTFDAVPAGQPTDTGGVVFTRDSLLAGLADSGFALGGAS